MGEEGISKRIDHFLLSTQLMNSLNRHRVWAHRSGISNHFPILLEWSSHHSCAYPFEFNHTWLRNEEFNHLIRSEWPNIQVNEQLDDMKVLPYKLRSLKENVRS